MPQAAPDAHECEEDNGDISLAFNPNMTMREMKASFKSNKGTLTRLLNQVKVRTETFVAIRSPGYKFLAKCDFLHKAAHQLALEDEENSAALMNAQEKLQPNGTHLWRHTSATGYWCPNT